MPRVAVENVARFPMQIPPPSKARLLRAAALENTSLKDFMLSNALLAADAVIEKAEVVRLNEAQSRFMLDLLDNPPEPNERFKRAAQALMGAESDGKEERE